MKAPFPFMRDEVSAARHTGREADVFGFWEGVRGLRGSAKLKNVGTVNASVMSVTCGIKEGDSRHSGLLRHLCAVIRLKL